MSSGARPSLHGDARAAAAAGGDRDRTGAASRPRIPAVDGPGTRRAESRNDPRNDPRADRDARRQGISPLPSTGQGGQGYGGATGAAAAAAAASTSHKRSASGNPRPTSRLVDERRTEKVQVTTRETLVTRTRSPVRRSAPDERTRAPDGQKQRAPEPRPREARPEPSPQGTHYSPFLSLPFLLAS